MSNSAIHWLAASLVPLSTLLAASAGAQARPDQAPPSPAPSVLTTPEAGPSPSTRPFHANLAALATKNDLYRRVIFTGQRTQLVLMSIPPGQDIGAEVHENVEQLLFIERGHGRVTLGDVTQDVSAGDVVVVTPGVRHDIVNTGDTPLSIATVYAPPSHIPGRAQATKAAAEADHEDRQYGHRTY